MSPHATENIITAAVTLVNPKSVPRRSRRTRHQGRLQRTSDESVKKAVSFNKTVQKRGICSRHSMTPMELDAVWVSNHEINQSKREAMRIIANFQNGHITCILGLEAYTPHGRQEKDHLSRSSIDILLADQRELQEEQLLRHIPYDERCEMLATMYREYSRQAADAAQLRAMQTCFDLEEESSSPHEIQVMNAPGPKSRPDVLAETFGDMSSSNSSITSSSYSAIPEAEASQDLIMLNYCEDSAPVTPVSSSESISMRLSPYPPSLLPTAALLYTRYDS